MTSDLAKDNIVFRKNPLSYSTFPLFLTTHFTNYTNYHADNK